MSTKNEPRVATREEWWRARLVLLAKEKELTRLRDEVAAERRALPRVRVEKSYVFQAADGKRTLAELFNGKSQLLVYHFMFAPAWEVGCRHCSFWADGYNGIVRHLAARDVSLVAVSKAPLATLAAFKERMGWSFPWVSSDGSDFNRDFGVSFTEDEITSRKLVYNFATQPFGIEEAPGVSVFLADAAGGIFHTYSCYSRGLDILNSAYNLLDLVPKGRDEHDLPYPMDWVRLRDSYEG
jgi:predicted dithiol-disulfide oxidoreductase (DUF899 family)